MEASLQEILLARETRVQEQQRLLRKYSLPLVCFTMNIAGPVKVSPLICRGFREGVRLLTESLPPQQVRFCGAEEKHTGCEAMLVVDLPASELKPLCVSLEESHPLGRLFDMDVLAADGSKQERQGQRGCMVCGAPGRSCAARRLHSVQQLQEVTCQMLQCYFAQKDGETVAQTAVQSLLHEVNTTPKPGLVDLRNNGSHRDMDAALFGVSARGLQPYFAECVKIGQETAQNAPEETFARLRKAGLEAEKTMYRVTGGVNTHKGAIYTMGILCGSIGRLWSSEQPFAPMDMVLAECARVSQKAAEADFEAITDTTAGGRLYLQYGLRGIRGQVAEGLPAVKNISLPAYEAGLAAGLSQNAAGAAALVQLIAQVEDTNLYHRGGKEGAAWAAEAARALGAYPSEKQLEELDDAFIERNLSPGGCADLLAVTYFLHSLYQMQQEETAYILGAE